MQTFLPLPDFQDSAKVLDYRRLGKQRVESKQIYLALTEPNYGWKHHPAVKMWKGYEPALLVYGFAMCVEWRSRGYKDTLTKFFKSHLHHNSIAYPPWFGDVTFHASHRAALLMKNFDYYKQFNWTETPNIAYVWPAV
jgi:hypothetical protein